MTNEYYNNAETLPSCSSSYWREHKSLKAFPVLNESIDVDVAIVGGGMTGILTAFLLSLEGKQVALIEGGSLLDGTTGNTTAKITAQHDVMYDKLIDTHGEEKARLYYDAQVEAMNNIKKLIDLHDIDCEYKVQDAYLHAGTEDGQKQLEKEMDAYEKLNIEGELIYKSELPFHTKAALVMRNQAHFHPVKFLQGIVEEIEKLGGLIYENTMADDITGDDPVTVKTRNGYDIWCDKVVMASHFPFDDMKGFYFSRLHPERSYAIAVKTEKEIPEGMYLGIDDPVFSLRHTEVNGEKLAIFGGEGHKTGKSEDTLQHFENIRKFADEHYGVKEVAYRWSAQDLIPPDNVPLIGQSVTGRPHVLTASGFKKWGMTNSMAAAHLLKDLITDQPNKYKELFDPTRTHLKGEAAKTLIKEMADDGAQMVKSRVKRKDKKLEELETGEGAVVSIKGLRRGAYKDESGELHIVDTTCTHMKCGVEWNSGERSWDCPCHGSRFSYTGEVLEGPATAPLKKIDKD